MSLHNLRAALPVLDEPVLVMHLEGWIDAGLGASAAMANLLAASPTELLADFDQDALIDHRARRPILHIENGVTNGLSWPEIHLRHGKDRTGKDLLHLVGPEPDMRWREFTNEIVGLASELGVRMLVGLGAFPAPVPHTRPVRLASTASDANLAAIIGFIPHQIDVPAGIQAVLEVGLAEAGIPAIGLWARVPHYVSGMPYPAASIALLDGLSKIAGIATHAGDLVGNAEGTHARIEGLMAGNDEHREMVRGLESQYDSEDAPPQSMGFSTIPTGDEIAEELERYLKGQGGGD